MGRGLRSRVLGQHIEPKPSSQLSVGIRVGGDAPVLPAVTRLDEVTRTGRDAARVIIAEAGLDMTIFPTAGHLVSWAKLTPRTIQPGAKNRSGPSGNGSPCLKGVLGEGAAAAARTGAFPGERYRRIVKRRGKLKALTAVARHSGHRLAPARRPGCRYHDLGASSAPAAQIRPKTRNHVRQLEALGYTVTVALAA